MLHCRGGAFYVGHTDNLELRIGQHQSGAIKGFTSDQLPVELVWSQGFSTRYEALTAERQIKGWSRAKKMALIRGDWGEVSRLPKKKDSPSTSSGRTVVVEPEASSNTVRAEPAEALSLVCHPETPSLNVKRIDVWVALRDPCAPEVVFRVCGTIDEIRFAAAANPEFADELWRTTCFEVFSKGEDAALGYDEVNLSSSGAWASYSFSSYRVGMQPLRTLPPDIRTRRSTSQFELVADVGLINSGPPWHIALSAIIEETDGTKSYWALKHPPGPPDFHHPDCFALTLAAPETA